MRKTIADIIRNDVNDPRIPMMTSVVEVKMSQDLSHATVFLSVMAEEKEKEACKEAIKSAAGFIKREATQRINLRVAPEMRFEFDDSIEKGMNLMKLIDETIKEDQSRE